MTQIKLKDLKELYEQRWSYPPPQKPQAIKYISCGKSANYDKKKRVYEPCWKLPMPRTAAAKYGPCWDYSAKRYKRFPLTPPCRGASMQTKQLLPKFDHCESFYTRNDFQLEQCVHQQILLIEVHFQSLEKQLSEAKAFQIEKAKFMRIQSIRRNLLIQSACGIKIYPEYLSRMTEERALCEFQKAYIAINESNDELAAAVIVVRDSIPELRRRLDKLDRSLESPFVLGLDKVLQTLQDLYDYFFEMVRKFKTWAQLIDAAQEHSINDYLALLRAECDFESFKRAGTKKCTCKRCRNQNPLEPYKPCWCQGRDTSNKDVKLFADYICKTKIDAPLDSSDSGFQEKHSNTSILVAHMEKSNE